MIRLGSETNKYLLAFYKANEVKVGDTFAICEYMQWIESKHGEFHALMSMPERIGYNKEEIEQFVRFLSGGAEAITEEEIEASKERTRKVKSVMASLGV